MSQDSDPRSVKGPVGRPRRVVIENRDGRAEEWSANQPASGSTRLRELLSARTSVRSYLPRPLAAKTIEALLDAARHAPSPHNSQPWRFAVVNAATMRERMLRAMAARWRADLVAQGMPAPQIEAVLMRSRQRVMDAPAVVVVFLDPGTAARWSTPGRQAGEHVMALQAVGAAIQTLLLAATAFGLGTCWICAPLFAPDEVAEALGVPRHLEAQALLTIGYPAASPKHRGRRIVSETVVFDDSVIEKHGLG